MSTIDDSFIEESNQKLDSLILEFNKKQSEITEAAIDILLNNISYQIKQQKRTKSEVKFPDNISSYNIIVLAKLYADATHTEDPALVELIRRKLELTVTENWFTPISVIRHEFDRINASKNFRIDVYNAYKNIWNYTSNKIVSILYTKYTIQINGEDAAFNQIENDLENKKNRIKKGNAPIKDDNDRVTDYLLNVVAKELSPDIRNEQEAFTFIKKFYIGKIESQYIPAIFNDSLKAINKTSPNKKYLAFYDLLSIVIKQGWNFMSEHDFDNLKTTGFKNYNDFKRSTVINILSLK